MRVLREIAWNVFGASFGVIVALWLVASWGAMVGLRRAVSLFLQHGFTWNTVATGAETEWFSISSFMKFYSWPAVVTGAIVGVPLVIILLFLVHILSRIGGTIHRCK